jgi:hypothetical protein
VQDVRSKNNARMSGHRLRGIQLCRGSRLALLLFVTSYSTVVCFRHRGHQHGADFIVELIVSNSVSQPTNPVRYQFVETLRQALHQLNPHQLVSFQFIVQHTEGIGVHLDELGVTREYEVCIIEDTLLQAVDVFPV